MNTQTVSINIDDSQLNDLLDSIWFEMRELYKTTPYYTIIGDINCLHDDMDRLLDILDHTIILKHDDYVEVFHRVIEDELTNSGIVPTEKDKETIRKVIDKYRLKEWLYHTWHGESVQVGSMQ